MEIFKDNWRYVFAILFLNVADFFLTKELIQQHDVVEANPIMFWAITYADSIWAILWFKAGFCSLLIVMSFFQPLNQKLMHITIWIYMAVVLYSIFLTVGLQ